MSDRKGKKQSFSFESLSPLIEDMEAAAQELENIPDDQEYTQENLEILEDVRSAAIKVKMEVEAIFDWLRLAQSPPG